MLLIKEENKMKKAYCQNATCMRNPSAAFCVCSVVSWVFVAVVLHVDICNVQLMGC